MQIVGILEIEQIEAALLSLPSNDFEKLRHWFFDIDYQRWDEQLERLKAIAHSNKYNAKASVYAS